MKKKPITYLIPSLCLLLGFLTWTLLILFMDVRPVGVNGSNIGLSSMNKWFFGITGSNMILYSITDWLGLVPIGICVVFGVLGLIQLIKRKRLFAVDKDILVLGIYYAIVILMYLIFEMIPINYRPILIDGHMEKSYPSSTTLLVLTVMPTLSFETHQRIENKKVIVLIDVFVTSFSLFMVVGRLISGVHWMSDIIGAVLLSGGLFILYLFFVMLIKSKEEAKYGI